MVETMLPDAAKTYSEMFRAAAAAQDIADYHDAIAGRDVGRIGKNFARPDIDPQTGEKGKRGVESSSTHAGLVALKQRQLRRCPQCGNGRVGRCRKLRCRWSD